MAITLVGGIIHTSGEISLISGEGGRGGWGRTLKIYTTVSRAHYESLDMQTWFRGKNRLNPCLHNAMESFVLLLFVSLARRHWERESRKDKVIQEEAEVQVGRLARDLLRTRWQLFIFKLYYIATTQYTSISTNYELNLLHMQWHYVIWFLVLVLWKLRESGLV